MKKITAVFISLLLILPALSVGSFASAADAELPRLIYEPVAATVRTGDRVVLSAAAQGKDLRFSWVLRTNEIGASKSYELSKLSGIEEFQNLDTTGKMKVSFKNEKLGDDQVKYSVIIDNMIYLKNNMAVFCTVSNAAGSKECDPALIRISDTAPAQADISLIAEFSVRHNKLVKLFCEVLVPKDAGYTDNDVEYYWFQTPDGDKATGTLLPYETDPVLMADGYATGTGTFYYYCQVFINYCAYSYYYETGVTEMTVYDPKNVIEFNHSEIVLHNGMTQNIIVTAKVDPEKDKGELSYQWYAGDSPDSINEKITGETSSLLTLTGGKNKITRYYTCVVNNHTSDEFDFDNLYDEKPYVKVTFTGEDPVVIKEQPKDVEAEAGETVQFSVKADNAKSYRWFMFDKDKGEVVPLGDDPDVYSGIDTDTLTVKALPELDGKIFFCNIANGSDIYDSSALAMLTVHVPEPAEYPKLESRREEIVAHVGDDVKLTVKASVSDGGTLHYKWYTVDVDPEKAGLSGTYESTEIADAPDSPEYKPDNSKEGVFYYICTVENIAEGKGEQEKAMKIFAVSFTPAGPGTGDGDTNDAETTGGDGGGSNSVLLNILTIVIGVLALALAGVGIYVLAKNRKKK